MKRTFLILAAVIGLGISGYGQNNGISINTVSNISIACSTGANCKYLNLYYDGTIHYSETGSDSWTTKKNDGNYQIDSNNKITIIWSNGYRESAQLSYSNGRAIIAYNGYTFYELRSEDCP